MDDDAKRAIALFRLGVLGPLVSARLEVLGLAWRARPRRRSEHDAGELGRGGDRAELV